MSIDMAAGGDGVSGAAPDLIGYADPLCVTPGDEVAVAVSSLTERYSARLVRFGGDEDSNVVAHPVEWELAGEQVGRVQRLDRGSYLRIGDVRALAALKAFTLFVWIYPTGGASVARAIAALTGSELGPWRFGLDATHRLTYWQGNRHVVSTPTPLDTRMWYEVQLSIDVEQAIVTIAWRHARGRGAEMASDALVQGAPSTEAQAELLLAAARHRDGKVSHHFNGKLEQPRVNHDAVDGSDLESLVNGSPWARSSPLFAAWDLSPRPGSDIPDQGPAQLHGELVNGPTRCVTGHSWRGHEVDWRQAPDEYAAIHFHDDDLDDAGWDADVRWRTPTDLASGVYGVHVESSGGDDYVPFVVSPSKANEAHDIAVLVPTFSYLAYANEHNAWHAPTFDVPGLDRATLLDRVTLKEHFIAQQRLLSLYEVHSDGSGVCLSSSRRPLLNMRPWYRMPIIDGGHQLSADLELLAWLEAEGFAYDVVSDHYLHAQGVEALSRHKVVVLGSHPEYWSEAMLDALADFLDDGGRVIYLGGNGLYWVTAQDPARPWVVEVRRGHSGTRCWSSEPGEVHLQSTGEPGGLWRHRGRPPQQLVGVGFTAQGFDTSLPYEATEAARDPRATFLFEGIDLDEPIGSAGSVLGGAGGFELDRVDVRLGTPPHALVVARATGYSVSYQAASEEIEVSDSLQGGPVNNRVRAEVVFYETPSGGAVLGMGSIAWCGALGANAGRNPAARLTANALRGFAALDFDPSVSQPQERTLKQP